MDGRKHREDGAQSKRAILEAAASIASIRGLEGLSIADVAREVNMSKGGLYAHFATKEALQLATIEVASEIFGGEVIEPAAQSEPGLAHLVALCELDLSYIERRVFPGGCFFTAVAAEYCGREGAVKDAIVAANVAWMGLLCEVIETAKERGELREEVDTEQLAFELNALIVSANFAYNLGGEAAALAVGRRSIGDAIERSRVA